MKPIRLVWLGLFLFLSVSVAGQTYNDKISDKEIKKFLKWLTVQADENLYQVKVQRVNDNLVKWGLKDFYNLQSESYGDKDNYALITSILTPENKDFLQAQIDQVRKKSHWKKRTLSGRKLIHPKWNMADDYWEYSVPLFTADKKFCFIKVGYHCGPMCANLNTVLYEWNGNGWKVLLTVPRT